jgi:hypothetical protein
MLHLEADGETTLLRAAVAYLSQQQGVIPLQLHGSSIRNRLVCMEADTATGSIDEMAQKLGLRLVQYGDTYRFVGW